MTLKTKVVINKMYKILVISSLFSLPFFLSALTSVEGHIKKFRRQNKCGKIRQAPDMKMIL